jgi:hypothetical protein
MRFHPNGIEVATRDTQGKRFFFRFSSFVSFAVFPVFRLNDTQWKFVSIIGSEPRFLADFFCPTNSSVFFAFLSRWGTHKINSPESESTLFLYVLHLALVTAYGTFFFGAA